MFRNRKNVRSGREQTKRSASSSGARAFERDTRPEPCSLPLLFTQWLLSRACTSADPFCSPVSVRAYLLASWSARARGSSHLTLFMSSIFVQAQSPLPLLSACTDETAAGTPSTQDFSEETMQFSGRLLAHRCYSKPAESSISKKGGCSLRFRVSTSAVVLTAYACQASNTPLQSRIVRPRPSASSMARRIICPANLCRCCNDV